MRTTADGRWAACGSRRRAAASSGRRRGGGWNSVGRPRAAPPRGGRRCCTRLQPLKHALQLRHALLQALAGGILRRR